MAVRNTILIRGDAREKNGTFSAVTRPGMLMQPNGTGGFEPHDEVAGRAAPIFAREQHELQGNDIDDNIASGDSATVLYPETGAVINAVTADTIDEGEWVESAGDGTVQLLSSGYAIGQAVKASDLSGTVGRVEIAVATTGV